MLCQDVAVRIEVCIKSANCQGTKLLQEICKEADFLQQLCPFFMCQYPTCVNYANLKIDKSGVLTREKRTKLTGLVS